MMTMANAEEPSASLEEVSQESTMRTVESSPAIPMDHSSSHSNDPSDAVVIESPPTNSSAPFAIISAPMATPIHSSGPESTPHNLPMANVEMADTMQAVVVPTQGYHLYQPGNASTSEQHNDQIATTDAGTIIPSVTDHSTRQQYSAFAAAAAPVDVPSEEEKEEIIGRNHDEPLAGMPTYEVDTSYMNPTPATVLEGHSAPVAAVEAEVHEEFAYVPSAAAAFEEDESELAALKRAAAFGGTSNQKPRPNPTENLECFFERTCKNCDSFSRLL